MIFSVDGSIEKIKNGTKTQTRRPSYRYCPGVDYAVQPGRTKPGILDGRILIATRFRESKNAVILYPISENDAQAEGGYTREEFEELYEKMYPNWTERWAYEFQFIPSDGGTP